MRAKYARYFNTAMECHCPLAMFGFVNFIINELLYEQQIFLLFIHTNQIN